MPAIRLDADGNFTYQHAKWVIIYNKDYSKLRERDGCASFGDLPAVETDCLNVKQGIKELGARDEDIIEIANGQRTDIMKMFQQINRECITKYSVDQSNTLVFIYYAGHGIMNNYTEMVLNNNDAGNLKFRVPIEKQMRIIATNPGTFVLGVLDCCRENFVLSTRGTGAAVEEEEEIESYCNLFITHGCAPSTTVDAMSTISKKYFEKLRSFAKADGTVIIPGRMGTWTPGNNGEHFMKYSNDLKLQFNGFSGSVSLNNNANSAAADAQAAMEAQRLAHEQEMQRMRQQLEMQEMQQKLAAQQAAAAKKANPDQEFIDKWKTPQTIPPHNPGLNPYWGAIEGGWIAVWFMCPHHIKQAWRAHEDRYETDLKFQAEHNQKFWNCFARFKDGAGAIHKNHQWIGFCKALGAAELDNGTLTDHQNYERWDGMNCWDVTHAGVTFNDYIQWQQHFGRSTKDRRPL